MAVLPGAPTRQVSPTWRKAGGDLAGREPPGRLRRLTGASVDHLRSSDRISDFDAALGDPRPIAAHSEASLLLVRQSVIPSRRNDAYQPHHVSSAP